MTTLFKKVAISSALAFTLAAGSISAQAAVVNFDAGINSFDTPTTAGSFTNYVNFTVAPNSESALSQTSVYLKNAGVGVLLSSLSLYLGTYTTAADLVGKTALLTVTYTGTNASVQHPSLEATTSLSTGQVYTLVTSGKSFGTLPTSYNTQVILAPVPEPETYAMLLAGLGVMGFVARRRQKKNG